MCLDFAVGAKNWNIQFSRAAYSKRLVTGIYKMDI